MSENDSFGLKSLTDDVHVAPKLAAAQIRHRGQMRRVRRYVAAGVAAVAVMAGGVATAVNLGSSSAPEWATTVTPGPAPTETPTQERTPLVVPTDPATDEPGGPSALSQPTWDNVPIVADLPEPDLMGWEVVDEYEGWGNSALNACRIADIQAETVLIREFRETLMEDGYQAAVTLGFASADEATAARETISEGYLTCEERMGEAFTAAPVFQEPALIPISEELVRAAEPLEPVESTAVVVALIPVDSDVGLISSATITQAGNRLTWMISEGSGMDHNCSLEPDGFPEQCTEYGLVDGVLLRLVD